MRRDELAHILHHAADTIEGLANESLGRDCNLDERELITKLRATAYALTDVALQLDEGPIMTANLYSGDSQP